VVALSAGVLNTFRRFACRCHPVLLNISFIACAVWLAPHLSRPILALAVAVVVGGVLAARRPAAGAGRRRHAARLGGLKDALGDRPCGGS